MIRVEKLKEELYCYRRKVIANISEGIALFVKYCETPYADLIEADGLIHFDGCFISELHIGNCILEDGCLMKYDNLPDETLIEIMEQVEKLVLCHKAEITVTWE